MKKILLSILAFLFCFNFGYTSVLAQSTTPEVILDKTDEVISENRTDPFFVYFNYGDPGVGYEVKDVQVEVLVNAGKLEIDKNNIYDVYDEQNPLNQVRCEMGSKPGFKIDPSFVNNNTLNYGPGSADAQKVGTKTSVLQAKRVGCLKIGLKVKQNSKGDGLSEINYNIKSTNNKSPFYKSMDEQPVKKVLFFVGQKETCAAGQEWKVGKCREFCGENMYRNLRGECLVKNIVCPQNQEIFDGKCLDKCKENESRSAFGECKPIEEPVSETAGKVLEYFLIGCLVLFLLNFMLSKLRKKR